MPCPYAERRGPVIICKVTNKKMNPLTAPCLTDRYVKCKYYKQATEKPRIEEKPPEEKAPVPAPVRQAEPVKVARKPGGEVKGITLDGRKPSNCTECIYYGSKTKTCLLLGVEIKDPYDPPCTRT